MFCNQKHACTGTHYFREVIVIYYHAERHWVEVNKRVNYPIKHALIIRVDHDDFVWLCQFMIQSDMHTSAYVWWSTET